MPQPHITYRLWDALTLSLLVFRILTRLEVENFPVIVVIDAEGNNLYETAVREFGTI